MKSNRKFYYIDESGNKKKYVGAIIDNHNGTFNGYLTHEEYKEVVVDLTYHAPIEGVEGSHAYYTYMNDKNEEVKYFGLTRTNEDGSKYFSYSTVRQINLTYKAPEEKTVEHFTYTDINGNTQVYTGQTPTFENGSYYGLV
jgi:hypothetical protein